MDSKEIKVDLSNTNFISKISSAINYLTIFKIANDENPIVSSEDYNDAIVFLNSFIYLSKDVSLQEANSNIELNQWLESNSQKINEYITNHPGQNGTQTPA